MLSYEALADGVTPDMLIARLMERVSPPDRPLTGPREAAGDARQSSYARGA